MAKFKKGDIVEDAHGNDYRVIMVESSTGRIAVQNIETGQESVKRDWELEPA